MPSHHVADELLLARCAAGLPEALDVLVASHLTLCPTCRAREETVDAVGGLLLAGLEPAPLPPEALGATLEAIRRSPAATALAEPPRTDPVLPAPIARYTGAFDSIRWTRRIFHWRRLDLPVGLAGLPARLLMFPAGWTVPAHTHGAVEHSLVLAGGYTDGDAHYGRGDVAVHPPGPPHRPRIDDDGPCVVLLVNSRIVPRSLRARAAIWLLGV